MEDSIVLAIVFKFALNAAPKQNTYFIKIADACIYLLITRKKLNLLKHFFILERKVAYR